MIPLVVVSHTYAEPVNRTKLHALAAGGLVTAIIPRRWRDPTLRRSWYLPAAASEHGVTLQPAEWLGLPRPSLGVLRVPRATLRAREVVIQVEEEPWTPTARLVAGAAAPVFLFTWENIARAHPWPWSAWRRGVFKRIRGLIAGSTGAAEVARTQGWTGPLAVIPQLGVPVPAALPPRAGDGPLRLAYVGRLVEAKGVDLLLRAAARLREPWALSLVGDGPARRDLERLAADLGLGERVRFRGAREHGAVAAIWAETDVLVLPSRTTPQWREQLGHVLLEAMAHGVAVVGSSSGAIPDVVGDAGLIFPEGRADSLAAQIAFLRDAERRHNVAEAGRRRVALEFADAVLARRTRAFHAEALAR